MSKLGAMMLAMRQDTRDGVTLGEINRRLDRLDATLTGSIRDLATVVNDRTVGRDVWTEAEADHERRISANERHIVQSESRFRATVLAVSVAIITSLGAIITVAVTAH